MNFAVGVVAEYNPYHLGHAFHIGAIKNAFPDAPIIAVMSANFLQRGVPALLDKWERAKACVIGGVDLVLELPIPFCCNNAGVFASAAVTILKATGVVDTMSFGMENPEIELANTISYILVQEPMTFKTDLQFFLKKGFSYGSARAMALEKLCPGAQNFLSYPNNTLAISYIEASRKQNADFDFLPIKRVGAGYRDKSVGSLMSASGIRQAIEERKFHSAFSSMPYESAKILQYNLKRGRCCVDTSRLWDDIQLLLTRAPEDKLKEIAGMTEGIESRFAHIHSRCESFDELVDYVSTRRYPKSRVRRQLISLLLNINKTDDMLFQHRGPAYIRPLAMSLRGRSLLRDIKKRATLPLAYKPAALKKDDYAQKVFSLGVRSSKIWESLIPHPDFRKEIEAVPFIGQ